MSLLRKSTISALWLLGTSLSVSVWAGNDPIGELALEGSASVTGGGATLNLVDQRYAYFSGDVINTQDKSSAVIVMNDGMRVRFSSLSAGRVLLLEGVYDIDLMEGRVTIDAGEEVTYRIWQNGELASNEELEFHDNLVTLTYDYTPAQLSDAQIQALEASGSFTSDELEALKEATMDMSQEELANMSEAQLRELLPATGSSGGLSDGAKIGIAAAIIVGAAILISDDDDDDGGSSGGGESGGEGGDGGTLPPPPPPPPAPAPPPGGSSTPEFDDDDDSSDDEKPGS